MSGGRFGKAYEEDSSASGGSNGLSQPLLAELQAAAAMPDDQINTADPDAPEVTDWPGAVRGRFYRPIKKQKTLRIDADVLAFFEAPGAGYQTRINRALRASMLRTLRRPREFARRG
jgi:uncharacterized protein (DUF4415 family)